MPYNGWMHVRKMAATAMAAGLLAMPALASGQDSAASEALFNKGVAEMEAGRFDAA